MTAELVLMLAHASAVSEGEDVEPRPEVGAETPPAETLDSPDGPRPRVRSTWS